MRPSMATHFIATTTIQSAAERLKGRPKLCSDCGVCSSDLRPTMARSCVFVENKVEALELMLHGRTRHAGDEMLFGIHRSVHAVRLRRINVAAQWSGIVTSLGAVLLERGLVDGVISTRAAPGTRFAPEPFLARTPAEVLASAGNKPCISPNLEILDQVRASGLRRIAFIGVGCQVHALRVLQHELGLEKLYVIGIPCTDNTTYPALQRFLQAVSTSPGTVVHYEFMQDFRIWLRHEDGQIEKINFVDLDVAAIGGVEAIFPAACMSCFDYQNTLADLTIGYLGAPLPPGERWQWVFVRTAAGQELFDLLQPNLEFGELGERGDRSMGMREYIKMLKNPRGRPPFLIRKLIASLQRARGPRGKEFARSTIEMKLLRNLQFVRDKHARMEHRVVPYHVYKALEPYRETYEQVFGRSFA
ncbi:coenzyme F420 hydrogenase [Candidatus Gracilibacteria bacterium]|nr:coenzyme F420 hydrogenase [Candidatus Gracilibacteria bacterium]